MVLGVARRSSGRDDGEQLTNDLIHNTDELRGDAAPAVRWNAEGTAYTTLEPAAPGAEQQRDTGEVGAGGLAEERATAAGGSASPEMELVSYDAATLERTVLVTAAQLKPAGHASAVQLADYSWSTDGSKLLVFTNTRKVWRTNTRGDYYWLDVSSAGTATALGAEESEEAVQMYAKFSPTGTHIGWVMHNNLWVQELSSGRVNQLTFDGTPGHGGMAPVINGNFDWAHEEELSLKDGWRWSPDGRAIAYWQLQTDMVQWFDIIDNTSAAPYTKLTSFPYPKVGTENATARIGVLQLPAAAPTSETETTLWMDLAPADGSEHYLASLDFISATTVAVQRLPREQQKVDVLLADTRTGSSRVVYSETEETWMDVAPMQWIDEERFVWLSDRSGFAQLYLVYASDGAIHPITTGCETQDVISIVSVDTTAGAVFFISTTVEEHTDRYLYKATLPAAPRAAAAAAGSAPSTSVPERLTPTGWSGTHGYVVSPGGRWAVHTVSSFGVAPIAEVVSLPSHEVALTLLSNERLNARLSNLAHGPTEFFSVEISDPANPAMVDYTLPAWVIYPTGFDRTKARYYPLLVYVYGGPGSTTVNNSWGDRHYLWHVMMAQQGYVVLSVDGRGTPQPYGREWRKAQYKRVGLASADDHAAAVQKLCTEWSFVDPEKIGTWGWSGGGSSTMYALCRHPALYKAGCAVAGNYDYLMYDSIWQERFMGVPTEDDRSVRQNYIDCSPIAFVSGLTDEQDLLIVHGTGDDNVHYQHAELLIDELVKQDKYFELIAYPNRTHAIEDAFGENTRKHLYESMRRHFLRSIPPVDGATGAKL